MKKSRKAVPDKKQVEEKDLVDSIIEMITAGSKKKGKSAKSAIKVTPVQAAIAVGGVVVIIAIAVGIMFGVQQQESFKKAPEIIGTWRGESVGHCGMPVYYNSRYVIADALKSIYKYDKTSAKLLFKWQVADTPIWAAENSKGETIVQILNRESLYVYKDGKLTGEIRPENLINSTHFNIDSKDNIYINDKIYSKVIKYSPQGEKLLELGGIGRGNGKFTVPGRIFFDAQDNVYVFDRVSPVRINIFTSEGAFVNTIKTNIKNLNGLETIAVTGDGNIYVNDFTKNSIHIYTRDGKKRGEFQKSSDGQVTFGPPGGMAGGIDDRIYVTEYVLKPIVY